MKPRKYLQGGAPVHELSWFVTGGHDLVGWRRHQKVLLKCTKAPWKNIVSPNSPVTSQPFYRRRWWLTLAIFGETMGWHAHSFRTIGDAHLHNICPFEELYIHCADVMAVVAQFGHLLPEKEAWESRVAAWLRERNFILHWPCLKLGYQRTHKLAIQFHTISNANASHFLDREFWDIPICTQFLLPCSITCSFAEAEAFAWGLCKSNIMFALFGGSSLSFSMQLGLQFCRSLAELEGSLGISHHDPSRTVLGGPDSPAFVLKPKPTGCVWKCWEHPNYPMVLLIIIPMKNGYFIGNIPYFQTNPTESNWFQDSRWPITQEEVRRSTVSRKTSWPWADCAGSWQLYTLARMVVGPWCRVQSSFLSSLPIHHECCVGVSENGDTHKRLF